MERNEILSQVTEIFRDVLDNEEIILNENSTADDVEEWDSLTHIMLVVAVEKNFKVKFGSKEIQTWENVGEMVNSITDKM